MTAEENVKSVKKVCSAERVLFLSAGYTPELDSLPPGLHLSMVGRYL